MPRSLRFRLLISSALCGGVLLTLLGLSIFVAIRHALLRDFDTSLITQARALGAIAEVDHDKISFEFQPDQLAEFVSPAGGRYFEIWDNTGAVVARSPSLDKSDLANSPTHLDHAIRCQLPNGRTGRSVTFQFSPTIESDDGETVSPSAPRTAVITVAAEPINVDRTLTLLAWLIAVLCAIAVIVLAFTLWQVVGMGLRPVRQLARRIGALRETDLDCRLATGSAPPELSPVVEKLNGLLSRLEKAFAREKAFSADAAHELRTPIAGLRATIEVSRSRPRTSTEYEAALDECAQVVDHMDSLVEALLLMARSDAGQLPVQLSLVNPADLVESSWPPLAARAESRHLNCSFDLATDCRLRTDADKLQIVLQNLLNNAVSYTNEGGNIDVALKCESATAILRITNTGSRIPPSDVPRLFEQFWRGDSSRTDTLHHSGLGLSLSQRLIRLLNATIEIKSEEDGNFEVTLILPDAQQPQQSPLLASATTT